MGIEFTPGWMMASMVISTVGFGLFMYGKKQRRVPQLIAGMALMIYPAFVPETLLLIGIGVLITGGMWYAVRTGS